MKNSPTRLTIIETASHLFYKKGYNLTGINEIIREAGIAKATLYSHFRSKEDICVAYLKFRNSTFLKDIKTFVLKSPRGKQQVLALFEFLHLFFNDIEFNGCWCIKTAAEIPKDNQKIKAEIQNQKNQFIRLIEFLTASNFPSRSFAPSDRL
ncbi:MAG: TetR/AcrR family transcriptional regulator, partial [Bacteroidota bacterium]